jgi:hypothetical protein
LSYCVIALEASQDLNAISDYFVSRNIDAGERLLQEFNQKCVKLLLSIGLLIKMLKRSLILAIDGAESADKLKKLLGKSIPSNS